MANRVLGSTTVNKPKQLYKYLLRECEKLPKHTQQFYKHSVKQVGGRMIFPITCLTPKRKQRSIELINVIPNSYCNFHEKGISFTANPLLVK